MNYSYDRLRGRIIEKYGTQEKFAEKLGLSSNSMSKKMNGKTGFSQKDIVEWSKLLDIKKQSTVNIFLLKKLNDA